MIKNYKIEDGVISEISIEEWFEWNMRHETLVAQSRVAGVLVSTAFIGLYPSYRAGPPLVFETMIFDLPQLDEKWLYATETQARRGHLIACERVLEFFPNGVIHTDVFTPGALNWFDA